MSTNLYKSRHRALSKYLRFRKAVTKTFNRKFNILKSKLQKEIIKINKDNLMKTKESLGLLFPNSIHKI